jgi:beta-lactamase class A
MAPIAPEISRRAALGGAALLIAPAARAADGAIAELERKTGGRIGLVALDTGSGKTLFHREAERFVMCSTFKLSLAAAILARADKGAENLDRLVMYDKPVLGVSPATTKNWPRGMTIAALCEAAIIYSDNTAANVLLAQQGGPDAVTTFWRRLGDKTSRLDDNEPKLNIPDGARNTTTPLAMMTNLKRLLLGDVLTPASRTRLLTWLRANTTGATRLRAGLPPQWQWGDKTGASAERYGLVNDIGIAVPPGRKPILMICYTSGGDENTMPAVGRILADAFA